MVVHRIAKESALEVSRTYSGLMRHVEPQYGFRTCKPVSQHSSIATVDLVSEPYHASMLTGGCLSRVSGWLHDSTWYRCARRRRTLPSPLSFRVSRCTFGGNPLGSCMKLICPGLPRTARPDLSAARPKSRTSGSLTLCCRVRLYVAAESEPCRVQNHFHAEVGYPVACLATPVGSKRAHPDTMRVGAQGRNVLHAECEHTDTRHAASNDCL